jgi:hypothetical protein
LIKTLASGRLDLPCGRIGGGFAAARQAKRAANAPKREFHTTFVGGHINMLKNLRHLKFTYRLLILHKHAVLGTPALCSFSA